MSGSPNLIGSERACTQNSDRHVHVRRCRLIGIAQIRLATAVVVLAAATAIPVYKLFSQDLQSAGIDIQARSRDILSHLNLVIQFYRASAQPIQKAGEPNDVVYRDQAVSQSAEIALFAFQSAKAEAALIKKSEGTSGEGSASDEQERMQATEADVEKQIGELQAREEGLEKQIAIAKPRQLAALEAEKKQVHEALDLSKAMKDALQKITSLSSSEGGSGLAADIDRIQHSVPELDSKNKTAGPQLTMLETARSSGVMSQGAVLIELFETRHSLDDLMRQDMELQKQAVALRAPLAKILRVLIQEGQQLSQAPNITTGAPTTSVAANPTVAPSPGMSTQAGGSGSSSNPQGGLIGITKEFKSLSAATVPLSQEVIVLQQSRANLAAWKTSADQEYNGILHSLLSRVFVIAIALALIIGGGALWTRAANKYVRDIRRRRQILVVRRVVVGFLSLLVIVFGFVTQFNSLATFAGFITAGIAVGLQTMLLSVAAYFFIIGRYGIKVGDRITIASVTGDVVDVGLVRFYMMELAGSGTSLNPTGRIAVFSNAVLFQAGTPLYKQIPGTEYAWHELIVKLTDAGDYKKVSELVMKEVSEIYSKYRANIERQHAGAESWMQASIDSPAIESRLQFAGGSFQIWARFPVEIENASEIDEQIIRALLHLMATDADVKSAIAATPVVQASVRG